MEYGLIGEHLSHSFSAIIHNKIGSYSYKLKELSQEELPLFLKEKAFAGLRMKKLTKLMKQLMLMMLMMLMEQMKKTKMKKKYQLLENKVFLQAGTNQQMININI